MAFWRKIFQQEEKKPASGGDVASGAPPTLQASEDKHVSLSQSPALGNFSMVTAVLESAHTTEKTNLASEGNTYIFKVLPGANRRSISRAVEARYGVAVDAVRTLMTPAKARVRGRITGWKPGFKKAMVTVRQGQKIEIQ